MSSAEELVFAGGLDGILRAFDPESGDIWETATLQSFGTPNGVEARGGAIEADGPVLLEARSSLPPGYDKWNEAPGNVLLVYSLNGQWHKPLALPVTLAANQHRACNQLT